MPWFSQTYDFVCDLCVYVCIQDGTKVLTASCDKTCKLWDLQSNQAINIGVVSELSSQYKPSFSLVPYPLKSVT